MTSKALLATPGTAVTFTASGGDVAFTLDSVATSAGRQSAQWDRGTTAKEGIYEWRAWVQMQTIPVVGETIDFYLKTSDGTHLDNDDGTGDIAVSAEDKLKNLRYIGSIVIDEASTTPEFSASGEIVIYPQYVHVVAWNATADQLSTTANDCGFSFTPHAWQGQDT